MSRADRPADADARGTARAAGSASGRDASGISLGGDPAGDWDRVAAAALAEVRHWRQAHPAATLTEIETAVEDRVRGLVARVVVDAAQASPAAAPPRPGGPRPPCPDCGGPMRADGSAVRRLTTDGDQTLTLRRSRLRCPACGAGLSPPG